MEYTFLSNTFFNTYVGNNTFTSVDKISVGNTVTNVAANSTTVTVGNTMLINNISVSVGANVSVNTSIIKVGNVSINTTSVSSPLIISGVNSINATAVRTTNFSGSIAATNNMTASASTSGEYYFLDFAVGVEVLNLPNANTIYNGYSVVVGTNNAQPSGFQTARVSAGVSETILYRGVNNRHFYLIGLGEHFRFTWMANWGGGIWIAECLTQPQSVFISRYYSGGSWNSGSTSWSYIPFNATSGGTAAIWGVNTNYIQVPVTGIYYSRYNCYSSAAAGGGSSGTAYVAHGAKNLSGLSTMYNYQYMTLTLNEDSFNLQTNWTTVFAQGEYSAGMYLHSVNTIWWYPPNSTGTVELQGR